MERAVAERLVDELSIHAGIIPPERELFMEVLTSVDVPPSSKFYEALPERGQAAEEGGRSFHLSLRRVLRNRNAGGYRASRLKRAYDAFVASVGGYSSDALSRRIRANSDLVGTMAECEYPFSLLGKFQIFDWDNPERLFIATRPVLVIPGAKDTTSIYEWEQANTVYEKESGLFRVPKRIRLDEYLSPRP